MSQSGYSGFDQFKEQVAKDPELQKKLREDPVKTIEEWHSPLQTDSWIYRIVVLSLGLTVVGCIIFAFFLALWTGKDTPQILIAIGSAAVGALAGLLAPTPKGG